MTGRVLTRRAFLGASASALAVASSGCLTATATDRVTDDAHLTSRPGSNPGTGAKRGAQPLDLHWARDGVLYVPTSYDPATPAPLVVLLHGAGGGSSDWWSSGSLARIADDLGVIIATPEARGASWEFLQTNAFGIDTDFIDRTFGRVFSLCNVDPTRIAIGGFSDGASYALTLGLANGDLLSAMIGFSAGTATLTTQRGRPRAFISHGTNDLVLSFDRGRQIADNLASLGHSVTFVEFDGGHVMSAAMARQALEWFVNG
jgi:phospholipase/carboxylesterase